MYGDKLSPEEMYGDKLSPEEMMVLSVVLFVILFACLAVSVAVQGNTRGVGGRGPGLRPPYFKRGEPVEICVEDHGGLLRAKEVWVPGNVVRRLRKGEDLPFKESGWEPIASWYLVRFDDDGSLTWVRKTDMRLPGGV